ncbi:MAG: HAD-IC family P-type ATPase, partial [Acidobacteriaceae bacterium]|nr:HAD-IC family P-type ATPase [Acidobacteriaceae bacterium]
HALGGVVPEAYTARVNAISRTGGTPLGVANGPRLLGIIDLRDIVKAGTKERMSELRRMGMRPVMITGDNPITAEAIAHEAGMQEVLAQATPADKLTYIKREQTAGRRVAMTGDGTNDAPALAQADVGLVMGSGTLAAQQAGNMVDLSSDPTKLIEVARISTELRLTRRAFTAFSVATSVIEYVLIVPVILATTYPIMERFKVLHFRSMQSAVLSALVFNVLACFALMPVALRGVPCTARNVKALLRPYVIGCALAGLVLPVMFFWIIEHLLGLMRLV